MRICSTETQGEAAIVVRSRKKGNFELMGLFVTKETLTFDRKCVFSPASDSQQMMTLERLLLIYSKSVVETAPACTSICAFFLSNNL